MHEVRTQDLVLTLPVHVGKQRGGGKALTAKIQKITNCQALLLSSPLQPPRAKQVVQRQTLPHLHWQLSTSTWKRHFSQAS